MNFPDPYLDQLLNMALAEDLGHGDVTTDSLIPQNSLSKGRIWAKEKGVIAGLPVAERIFQLLGSISFEAQVTDGAAVKRGQTLAYLEGCANILLRGERLALNFLQRLSGIATRTRKLVSLVEGYDVRIVDTRKTTPLWRALEKYAVRMGGGLNHRFGLFDAVLIKDNHIKAVGSVEKAVTTALEKVGHTVKVEVEVNNLHQLEEALEAGAHIVLLDNMELEEMEKAVALTEGRALLEASGSITEKTLKAVAQTGVDAISIGALTHSVRSLDLSLDFEDENT